MSDVAERLATALQGRYTIERELGAGGMATVYLAEDLKHRRHVAIKVLRPELAESLGAERFLREVAVTAKLNHPHILPLLDSGSANGFLFYVMPYIEGETLRARITREGQLPLDDALAITREVAAALSYAHSQGVIHRDIKPENILLSAGEAVVADFGIARAIRAAGGERLTETGLAVGTPAYMSPEQASGAHELDGRSDIYALGCVLYEMLSGEAPYTAPTPQALIAKKLAEPTPRISVVRETVPGIVEAALSKALAKTPADRFVTAQQFSEALTAQSEGMKPARKVALPARRLGNRPASQWAVGLAALVAVGALGVVLLSGGHSWLGSEAGAETIDRLVVAPLENRTADSAAADWGYMAADVVTRSIDRGGFVTVVPGSVVRDALREVDPAVGLPVREIARRTAARYAVAGSYTVSAGRLRFEVELLDAASGEMLRGLDPVSGPVDSLEAVAAVLAERVTAATMALLNPVSAFAQWSSPPSLEVFRKLMATQDMFCRGRSQEAIDEALLALEQAPDFAPLLMYVMFSHWNAGHRRESDSVLRIIEPLMEQLSTAERLLVEHHHGNLYGDRTEVTRAVEQLFRIQPGSYGYHAGLNAYRMNRLEPALEYLHATNLDSPCYSRWVAWWTVTAAVYHLLGQYEEELDVARRGLERYPNHFRILDQELAALAALGRLSEVDSLLDVIAGLPAQERYGLGLRPVWVALELKAHGHREAYEAAMHRALAWFASRPASSLGGDFPYDRARAFYYAQRWSDADTLFAALSAETTDNLDYRGYRAIALAHLGRREEALEADRWLAQLDRPFLLGEHTRWRAAIAAALGDREGAVHLLQQAIREGLTHGTWQHRDPEWEALRDYRPYQELMRPKR